MEKTKRTLAELAQQALDVQDACNLSGVLLGAHNAVCNLRELLGCGTDELNEHPISQLWADKIASLARTQFWSSSESTDAYDWCERYAKGLSTEEIKAARESERAAINARHSLYRKRADDLHAVMVAEGFTEPDPDAGHDARKITVSP